MWRMPTVGACGRRYWAAENGCGILREKVRLVARAARGLLEQQRQQPGLLEPPQQRPVEREQQHRFSSRKPLQADAGPIWWSPGVFLPAAPSAAPRVRDYSDRPCGLTFVPASLNGAGKKSAGRSLMPPPRPDGLWLFQPWPTAGCGGGSFGPVQFTPGSLTTRLTRPPLAPSDREYTPARSADKHLPEAHWRNPSILSPAVTATGTTFCAA